MPVSTIYYIDSDSFNTATAVYMDINLSTKAQDGYYSFSGIYRYQSLGFLGEVITCGIFPPPPPAPSFYKINISNSVPINTCFDPGIPSTFPLTMYSGTFPISIGQTVYYNEGLSILFEGDDTWYWYGTYYAYRINSSGVVVDIVTCEL